MGRPDDSDEEFGRNKQFEDFKTNDEFERKNYRVRPTSSMWDEHEKGAKASSIHSVKETGNDEDDDRKFNREQQIDFNFMRAAQKEKRQKEEE